MFAAGLNLNESGSKLITGAITSVVMSVLAFVIGRYWGRYKAYREWSSKEFMNRVIVSLNLFADGFLKIRTVMERSIQDVFLNPIAIEKIRTAAKLCTPGNPILPIPKEDRWYLLNFVLNAVAEKFVDGQIRQDAGAKTTTVQYVLFLTCEVVGDERIRKVRAMLLKKDYLTDFPYLESLPKLENPWHEDRIRTLRQAVQLYKTEPDHFMTFEACV